MACGSCGGGKIKKYATPSNQMRLAPNPITLQAARIAAIRNAQANQNAAQATPALASMSRERRSIEQKRRLAALRAIGK